MKRKEKKGLKGDGVGVGGGVGAGGEMRIIKNSHLSLQHSKSKDSELKSTFYFAGGPVDLETLLESSSSQ